MNQAPSVERQFPNLKRKKELPESKFSIMKTRITSLLLGLAMLSSLNLELSTAFAQSTVVTYQGRVQSGGEDFTGTGQFKFALVTGVSPNFTTHWSNDGTSADGSEPVAAVSVTVEEGLFSVRLGDTALANMMALSADLFEQPDLHLRIWFDDGVHGFSALSPTQPLTAVPYAMMAEKATMAETVNASSEVTLGSLTLTGPLKLGYDSNWHMSDWGPGNGPEWFPYFTSQQYDTRLHLDDVLQPAPHAKSYMVLGGAYTDTDLIVDGRLGLLNDLVVGYSGTTLFAQTATGNVGIGTVSPSAKLTVDGAILRAGSTMYGSDAYTHINLGMSSTTGQSGEDRLYATVGGGANNTASATSASVGGGFGNLASGMGSTVPGGQYNEAVGDFSLAAGIRAKAHHTGSFVWADSVDANFASTAPNQFLIRASGGVGIGTTSPQSTLDVNGTVSSSGLRSSGLQFAHGSTQRAAMWPDSSGGPVVYFTIGPEGTPIQYKFYDTGLDCKGFVACNVLQIKGGADLAEPFQVSTKDIPKGSVVVIDDENPGRLKVSQHAYDTRVAGVISGANGINPGITLNQQSPAQDGQNVALSGRVYAFADAANGLIRPGDLLTTSATPGHAMKVTDHARAQGAILGKAMSALPEGKGMVLVLVSLQ